MFCHNILLVFLDTRMASEIASTLSFINTTSAASIAASDPTPPIAIPISALARTGASLIPSPTNKTFPFADFLFSISSTLLTLSLGNNSA